MDKVALVDVPDAKRLVKAVSNLCLMCCKIWYHYCWTERGKQERQCAFTSLSSPADSNFAFWGLLRCRDSPRTLGRSRVERHLSRCDGIGAPVSCSICCRQNSSTCLPISVQRWRIILCRLIYCEVPFRLSEAFRWRDCVCLPRHGSGGEQLFYCQDHEERLLNLPHWTVSRGNSSEQ